jgi:transcriptional regulator with XRE-family HTH domain
MPLFDGALLRARRTDLKLSRRQLGDLADVPFYMLAKMESGEIRPSVVTLERLCRALGVDPNALFSGEVDDDADIRPTDLGDATDQWIKDTLASAPPLTERQAARLAAILFSKAS